MVGTRPAADGGRYKGEEEMSHMVEMGLTNGKARIAMYTRWANYRTTLMYQSSDRIVNRNLAGKPRQAEMLVENIGKT